MIGIVRILKHGALFLATFVLLFSLSNNAFAQSDTGWTGNVNLLVGYKELNDDDWKTPDVGVELDDCNVHGEFGIDVDFKNKSWPISINTGYLLSAFADKVTLGGEDFEYCVATAELFIGVKKIFNPSPFIHPFINGGISHTGAVTVVDYRSNEVTEDDSSLGYWCGGGVYFTLIRHLNLGLNFRYSKAEVTLDGKDMDAGGLHYAAMVGFHW